MAFVDDADYPFEEFADDYDIIPDADCARCAGSGVYEDLPCSCMVAAAIHRFHAEPSPESDCLLCEGVGEDDTGHLCVCLLVDVIAEALEQ